MKLLIALFLLSFALPASACSLVRGGMTNDQVTTGLYSVCAQQFSSFDPSYCQLYATQHLDAQGCMLALSAPYGFVVYASIFGDLVEPAPLPSDTQLLTNIYLVLQIGLIIFSLFIGFIAGIALRW